MPPQIFANFFSCLTTKYLGQEIRILILQKGFSDAALHPVLKNLPIFSEASNLLVVVGIYPVVEVNIVQEVGSVVEIVDPSKTMDCLSYM